MSEEVDCNLNLSIVCVEVIYSNPEYYSLLSYYLLSYGRKQSLFLTSFVRSRQGITNVLQPE